MGRDKSLVVVDGVPMAGRVARAMVDAGLAEVVAVGGDVDGLASFGLRAVPDDFPSAGPLGGVLTALRHAESTGHRAAVVVACDMPDVSAAAIAELIAALVDGVDVAIADDGRPQPLLAAWSVASLLQVSRAMADGVRAVREVWPGLDARAVPVEPSVTTNVNHPGDLQGR